MTFDEWWDAICEEVWRMDDRETADFVRAAWEAATQAERERCAKLCDEIEAKAVAHDKFSRSDSEFGKAAAADACAEAIRAS